MKSYCSQNNGKCESCSLVNYGRDCQNNPVAIVDDGRCQCGKPVILCEIHEPNHSAASLAWLDYQREKERVEHPEIYPTADEAKGFFND